MFIEISIFIGQSKSLTFEEGLKDKAGNGAGTAGQTGTDGEEEKKSSEPEPCWPVACTKQ